MDIVLTNDQKNVLKKIDEFYIDDENPALVIKGCAGVGKSKMTQYITNFLVDVKHQAVLAIAPTHKARRVLNKFLNVDRFITVPTVTVASVLGKMREHSYIGTHKYSDGSKQKMDKYDYFILDEVSMVSDTDLNSILEYICEHDKKIIMIGDDCQIPSPSQHITRNGHECYKPDSTAFDIENCCHMKEIVRQVKDSPIIKIASFIRDNMLKNFELADVLHSINTNMSDVCISFDILYDEFKKDWMNSGTSSRIIAYTNNAVKSHNKNIRKILGYNELVVSGELLTGYSNVGFPEVVIENGTDYIVYNVQKTSNYFITSFFDLNGYLISLQDVDDSSHISPNLFMIDVKHSSNNKFMKELVLLAKKVNSRYSTKDDFKKYAKLKNCAVFIEDIYEYNNVVMTETNFKQLHPLLFTKISEVINAISRQKISSELALKLEEQYGDIIEGRIIDNKTISDTETFSDSFMVVEKDIYYGYSITSHKSQGSTYENVYVDEHDFKKIANRWNYKMRCVENRTKERNQLKYVSYTRASKKLKIIV